MIRIKCAIFGILLLASPLLIGMDSALLIGQKDEEAIMETRDSAALFPSLLAAQSVIADKNLGKVIAQMLLRPEAKTFILRRLSFFMRAEMDVKEWMKRKVIPFHKDKIGILAKQKLHIWSTTTVTAQRIMSPEIRGDELFAKRNKKGDKVVTTDQDHYVKVKSPTARVWNIDDGNCVGIFNSERGILQLQFRGQDDHEQLIAASEKSIRVWSTKTGLLVHSTDEPDSKISSIETDSAATQILVSFNNRTEPEIWNLISKNSVRIKTNPFSIVYRAKFSPQGDVLAIYSSESLGLYHVATGSRFFNIDIPEVSKIAWGVTGENVLIVGLWHRSNDRIQPDPRIAYLLHIEDQSASKMKLTVGERDAHSAAFNKARDTILSANKNIAYIWCAQPLRCLHELIGHADVIHSLCFNEAGNKALTHSSSEEVLRIWEVDTGLCLHVIPIRKFLVRSFFSQDTIVSTNESAYVECYQVRGSELFKDVTFEQAYLINAIYEIVILRRLATIRAAARAYQSMRENEDLLFLEVYSTPQFSERMQKLKKQMAVTFLACTGIPQPIVTKEGTVLRKEDFIFDFTTMPEQLLAAYTALCDEIRTILDPFVKTGLSVRTVKSALEEQENESSNDTSEQTAEESESDG